MSSHRNLPYSCLALLCAAVPAAAIDPLIDNLSEPLRDNTVVFFDGSKGLWAAQTFHADGNRYRLDSIETIMGTAVGRPLIVAELRAGDDPTAPILTTVSVPVLSTEFNKVVTLTPEVEVIIEPGQAITLILGVVGVAEYQWAYADTNNWVGPGAFGNYHYSFDAGKSWTNFGSDFPYYLRVNVSAIVCQPDCNEDGKLDVSDFGCFTNKFVLNDPYADCNADTVFDISDFGCFTNQFLVGCP